MSIGTGVGRLVQGFSLLLEDVCLLIDELSSFLKMRLSVLVARFSSDVHCRAPSEAAAA